MLFFRLLIDNSTEKKHVKSLNATVEALETKCEDLQSTVDDLHLQIDLIKRRSQRNNLDSEKNPTLTEKIILRHTENRLDENDGKQASSSSLQAKQVSSFIGIKRNYRSH